MLSSFAFNDKMQSCMWRTKNWQEFQFGFFEQITNTSEPLKEHVTKELLILTQYQMDSKEIRCHFQWLRTQEVVFLIVDFFHLPNLRHCKITNWEWKNFFKHIFTNLKKCLQWDLFFENVIFVRKKW
jgi:hypothetical protein